MSELDRLVEETLPDVEQEILDFTAQVLTDKTVQSQQRIAITNLLVTSAADIRNAITRLQQALPQYKQAQPKPKAA